MNVERELIISVLKLTTNGASSAEIVSKDAKIPLEFAHNLLVKMQEDGLIYLWKDIVEVDYMNRIRLAVRAIKSGADVERATRFLQWKEFENIVAVAFERNGFVVRKNLRFKQGGRRWEMDIVGCKKPLVVCVDCKHWHHGISPSVLKKIVKEQVERTFALGECLPELLREIEWVSWNRAELIPVVLSLVKGRFKFYDRVPIVTVLQLQDFLNRLPAYADSLKHFSKHLANQLNSRS